MKTQSPTDEDINCRRPVNMTERTQEGFKKINGELIPVWDGKAEKFEDYRIRSRFYVRSGDAWKASQKIGNLIQALGPDVWGIIQNLSEAEQDKLCTGLDVYFNFLKENCMPAVIPELGRRFREWLKFGRTRREGMRLYYKRYSQQLSKLETCIKAVQDTNKDYLKLKLAIRKARVQLDAGNLRGFGSRTSSMTGNSQNSKATLTGCPV